MTTIRLFNADTIIDSVHDMSEVPTVMPQNVTCLARVIEGGRFCYRTNPMHKEEIELYVQSPRGDLNGYAHGKKVDFEAILGEMALATRDPRYQNMLREIRSL